MDSNVKSNLFASLAVVFFLGFALFFAKWWLEGDSYRKENKRLNDEIAQIQHTRDSLKTARDKIDLKVDSLQGELKKTFERIAQLDLQLKTNKVELQNAKSKLSSLQAGLIATRRKIQELEAKPIKRTGQSLLDSIKEKTK